jgi:aspartate 1-decarboxylase
MLRTMLKSKIHRATVTGADQRCVGPVTVDAALMEAADLLAGEQVTIVDVTNGACLQTYVITGERGSGVLGIHSAALPGVRQGDLVNLLAYGVMDEQEARSHRPRVVSVDAENRVAERGVVPDDSVPAPDDGVAAAETDDAAKLDALLQQPAT